jgi:hypothetical protein
MSKVLVIPDPHESPLWKYWVTRFEGEYDLVIFMGDYFDDWNSDTHWSDHNSDPISNFEDIMKFYKDHVTITKVLIGNHDLAYLTEDITISGHQLKHAVDIKDVLEKHLDDLLIATNIDGTVYSHAGLSKTWVTDNYSEENPDINDLINKLNTTFHHRIFKPFEFNFMTFDRSGDDPKQGPLWIRPQSLSTDMVFRSQVVGHTELIDEDQRGFDFINDRPVEAKCKLMELHPDIEGNKLILTDSDTHAPLIIDSLTLKKLK